MAVPNSIGLTAVLRQRLRKYQSLRVLHSILKGVSSEIRAIVKKYFTSPLLVLRLRSKRKLRLNIGCGGQHLDGYVNIDINAKSKADLVVSAQKLPFDDGQATEIFTSHVIEHIPREALMNTLKEWHRVLEPGGQVVVRCPNLELYMREWLEGDEEWRWGWGLRPIFGWEGHGRGMWHLNGFTVTRLEQVMRDSGFEMVSCNAVETRPLTRGTVEHRPDGDILYIGTRIG